ncbi:hypothetical protein ACFY9N_03035 [Microbacterium sp. NPDC008134]|uniref:hypothetical protein n=1 Tax=Microbacterium sp. NPDC008134 TaxID=3364183 RepID=UPI0036EECA5A
MIDDTGILIFLGVGVLVVIGIVVFGVLSSKRKKNATMRTFTVRPGEIGSQPFLESNDIALDDKRQEELFRLTYEIGGELQIPSDDEPDGRTVRISRVSRSLRAGFPQAKIGMSAYFREWENSEFPARFPVRGDHGTTAVTMDAAGVTALDANSGIVWTSPWSALRFSNGPDLVLLDSAGKTVRLHPADAQPEIEEIVIKYGTLQQMHF